MSTSTYSTLVVYMRAYLLVMSNANKEQSTYYIEENGGLTSCHRLTNTIDYCDKGN
jgi:hypothetical protein